MSERTKHLTDSERRKKREAMLRSQDQLIGEHLAQAYRAGELQSAESFGKPLAEPAGYRETPDTLRMPYKILKNAGVMPPEIELFHQRAALRREIELTHDEAARKTLQRKLAELEQFIALRLEGLRAKGRI